MRPTASAYSNLGNAYFYSRRFREAAQAFEQAVRLNEQDYEFWWNLGDAYYWTPGSRTQAFQAYRQAISLAKARLRVNPRDAHVLGVLAVCHAMLGKRKMALEYLQHGLRLAPDDPDLRFKSALVHNQFGEIKPALAWLEKAVAAGWSPTKLRDTPDFEHLRSHTRFQELLQGK
jgi:serine/threonine-protein kinase